MPGGIIVCGVELIRVDTKEFIYVESGHKRLDIYVAEQIPDLSRSLVQKLIGSGHVLVNGAVTHASYKLQAGDVVGVIVPAAEPTEIVAEDIPLDIVYEDDQIMVINKAKGMTVHPAPGSKHGTLVNAILAHCDDLSGIGGVERPGIVHRLDKDTSGLLVVAKTDAAHASLQMQIQERAAERRYYALVWGATKFNEAVVDAPIGRHPSDRQKMTVIKETERYTSRVAITHLKALERFDNFTLLEAKLETGRTHQIRVHCAFICHPVVGDPVYGGIKRNLPSSLSKISHKALAGLIEGLNGQALHAYSLSFDHPITGERLSFEAPMPADMQAIITWLTASDRTGKR